jgi:hypothetical protein
MPAKSEKQRRMMAIAEHHPEKLYAKNRGVLEMSKKQLSDFASTPEKGLPEKKKATHHSAAMGSFWEKRSKL